MIEVSAFDNSYARLPDRFHARLAPTPVAAPQLVKLNLALAEELGLDPAWLTADVLSGNRVAPSAEPVALAYAGHQFGHFVPQLGDGRAVLLGEVIDRTGARRDIQLKGSGQTPFSRQGDGRAALGPVLREFIISEAMAALGIPTTRSLAAVTTGEMVWRETRLPGAVLTRVASSHIRVGTFQYFAARGDTEGVALLADHAIARHYPEARDAANPYAAFLTGVAERQAELVARWLLVGFIHGVMNTDNCAISGETIDYGPCAFMDAYDPSAIFSSIDHAGRYAYANQPRIAQWNVARLAETLLPLLGDDDTTRMEVAQTALRAFAPRFETTYQEGLRRKIGLASERDGDAELVRDLLQLMFEDKADFTLTFRQLGAAAGGPDDAVAALFVRPAVYRSWAERWRARLAAESHTPDEAQRMMDQVNPAFIPRNHIVEAVLQAAVSEQDYAPFETLLQVLARPFEDNAAWERYTIPPAESERVTQTFCGT
jgi:serine/tyrosine/threonine adenylyltransferase